MLTGLVSAMLVFSMYRDMDEKGKTAVGAFLVGGTSLLSAHMGFVLGTEPGMLPALMGGKICAAAAAVIASLIFGGSFVEKKRFL